MVLGSPLIGHVYVVIAILLNMCLQQFQLYKLKYNMYTNSNNSFPTQIASRRQAVWFSKSTPTFTNLDIKNNHKHNRYIHAKCCNNVSLRFHGGPYRYFIRYSKF